MHMYPHTGLDGVVATLNDLFRDRALLLAHGKDVAIAHEWLSGLIEKLFDEKIWSKINQCGLTARAVMHAIDESATIAVNYPLFLDWDTLHALGLPRSFHFIAKDTMYYHVETVPHVPAACCL